MNTSEEARLAAEDVRRAMEGMGFTAYAMEALIDADPEGFAEAGEDPTCREESFDLTGKKVQSWP